MERWRLIEKQNAIFQVSNKGRVKIFNKDKNDFEIIEKFSYTGGHEGSRYFSTHRYYVHRLVAEAWIGEVDGMEVNHKDGQKFNNDVSNLEIVTTQQNQRHSWEAGLRDKQKLSKQEVDRRKMEILNKQWAVYDLNFNILNIYSSQSEAAKSIGVSRQAVNNSYRKGRSILKKYYVCRINQEEELKKKVISKISSSV